MHKYRVTIWLSTGGAKRRIYLESATRARKLKIKHAPATIHVWAGTKNGWQLAEENAVET